MNPLDRVVGSTKRGKKRYKVCMNVSETNTFTSKITGETYKINHKLTFDNNCLICLTAWGTMVSLTIFQEHLLTRPTVKTLKREKITGGELSKPIRSWDLMLKTVSDQHHIAKNVA